jgi:hypothetical protein
VAGGGRHRGRVPLDQRTKDALATVKLAMQGESVGQVDLVPYWHFPSSIPELTRVRFVDGEGWDVLRTAGVACR